MTKRRKEREFVLQVLYAQSMNDIPIEDHIEEQQKYFHDAATDFAKNLARECVKSAADLDALIKKHSQHWDFDRLAMIDRLLLRMALAEFLHFEDIPPEVTMDETIEIGKAYSTEQSSRFINGMLDALLKQLKKENKIQKSGRGRISKVL